MKRFIQKIFVVTATVLACATAFGSCSFATGFLEGKNSAKEDTYMAVRAVSPKSEGRVSIANDEMTEFANGYVACYASNFNTQKDHFVMKGLTLEWEADNAPNAYTVALSEKEDLSDAMIYQTENTQLHIDDLFVNTCYFWQVTAHYSDKDEMSKINRFTTAYTPRTIDINGVSNTRDLGGKNLENGKQFRQGMVYRGGKLDDITEKGKIAAKEIYGIKTDLDLRNMAEGTAGEVSPLGEDIHYVHVNESPYYLGGKTGIDAEKNKAIIAQSIRVFADESNYPIYVHCSLGRDRTAAVCMLIEGLLGMSRTDMEMDYETSFFSQMGSLDGQTVEHMYNSFKQMYNYVAGMTREDFSKDCEAYLLGAGITEEEIASIRKILTK